MAALDLANVINISLSAVPSGLPDYNVNILALYTTENPTFADEYRDYLNAGDVATDFGTNSDTYAQAVSVFSQNPNILSGAGFLRIVPLNSAVSATQGKFETASLTANVDNFKTIANGEFKLTLNGGTAINIQGLNFTRISTLSDIALVLQNALTNVIVTVDGSKILFTSKKFGAGSAVVIDSISGGTGTDLKGSNFLNVTAGTGTSGANSSGETLIEAVNRLEPKMWSVGTITNLKIEETKILSTAQAIQSKNKVFIYTVNSTEDIAGIVTDIKDAGLTKTRLLLYGNFDNGYQNLFASGYAGRGFSTNYNASNSAMTMHLKEIIGITPDSTINQTIKNQADAVGLDMYVNIAGDNNVWASGGNDFFDNVVNDIWLKLALQVAGYNYLKTTNTKIPQTEVAMQGLKNAYELVLEKSIRSGVLAVGNNWNSSQTFGDPETFRKNITLKGYYVYSYPIALQSQNDREQRKAPVVQIAGKRAGAIHSDDVVVTIEA